LDAAMTLWFAFALMTTVAIFAVLWPLSRVKRRPAEADGLAVYRDQLQEIDRDRAAGRIGTAEADAARVEVSRRLIAADRPAPKLQSAPWRRRAVAVSALTVLPVAAALLYLALGSPQRPGAPLAGRSDGAAAGRSVERMVEQVEAHLAGNPDDGRGWEVLAPVYMRLGRFAEAAAARRNAIRTLGATADREADLAEALIAAADGVVTADANAAIRRALALDAKHFKARFFAGLAAEQDGRKTEAAEIWQKLVADAPPDSAWLRLVRQAIARLSPAAPGPTRDDVAAAADMKPEQRAAMIRGMVERLAERLKKEGSDLEGWLRLVRAYMVLGERDTARAATADARRALAGDPGKLDRLERFVKGLGLAG
jgi:cytochrome c-type biogenesis protein CcmH